MIWLTFIWVCYVAGIEAPPLQHFSCGRAASSVVIDGKGDEAAWQAVEPITEFRLWRTFGAPTEKTSVRFCYDDANLYALFECSDKDVFALYGERDARLWESDVVELFFHPDPANPMYYEFEIAPNNAVFDARMVNTGSGGFPRWAAWNCDIRTAVRVHGTLNCWEDGDEGYTVELAIPLDTFHETIGAKPLPGQTWKFAAVRVDLSATLANAERSSTANVPDGDIHQKDGYATLTFIGERKTTMKAFGLYLDGCEYVHIQLWDHLRAKTFAALDHLAREKAAMTAPEQVRQRAQKVRTTFLDAIGGLPASDTPLNARTVGAIPRDAYTIEKVIFESQPSVYVTALAYIPKHLNAPAPGILFVCGHAREAKGYPEYQRVCHDLALNRFVVLAMDSTGQGERVTHLNPDTGGMTVGWGTTEHSYQGFQCILTGSSIARYFLFDALRGIDYLQSRPEVDPARIGVTGNSGGGTQTTLVCMSGNERIKAAVPCTFVTSREHYFMAGQPQDAEQLCFGMTKNGINFDDCFWPFAPRPLLIGAVDSDFFNPEGTALTYERLKSLYRLLDAENKVEWVLAPGGHRYSKELREAAVNWFRKHLLNAKPVFVSKPDDEIETLPDSALWCTSKGHVLTDFPQGRTPYHLNLELLPKRRKLADVEALRDAVIDTLAIRERLESPAEMFPRVLRVQKMEGAEARSIFFISEPGIMTTGCLVQPDNVEPTGVILFLAKGGTNEMDQFQEPIRNVLAEGRAVFVYDVRGTGAVAAHPVNPRSDVFPETYYNTEGWFSFQAYCLGESLLGMRVFDVLRAAHYLRTLAGYKQIGLHAQGLEPALWGYLAAALDNSITPVRIEGLIESYEAIVRTSLYRTDLISSIMVHGILQHFDLPDLRVLFDGRELTAREESVAWRS